MFNRNRTILASSCIPNSVREDHALCFLCIVPIMAACNGFINSLQNLPAGLISTFYFPVFYCMRCVLWSCILLHEVCPQELYSTACGVFSGAVFY